MAALRLGDAAPGFDLADVDGERHALSDYDGKPFAVVFSCCHCPYVVAWEERLNEAARDFGGRAGFVAVNSNAGYLGDSLEDMARRSQERGFVFPFLYDETQEVARAYGAARTPSTTGRRTRATRIRTGPSPISARRSTPRSRRHSPRCRRRRRSGAPSSGASRPRLARS